MVISARASDCTLFYKSWFDHLYTAIINDDSAVVQIHLENERFSEGDRGWSISLAATKGHLAVVKVLLTDGKITKNDRGEAVINAAENGHFEIVQTLLADGPISDVDRTEARLFALAHNHPEIARLLQKKRSCAVWTVAIGGAVALAAFAAQAFFANQST